MLHPRPSCSKIRRKSPLWNGRSGSQITNEATATTPKWAPAALRKILAWVSKWWRPQTGQIASKVKTQMTNSCLTSLWRIKTNLETHLATWAWWRTTPTLRCITQGWTSSRSNRSNRHRWPRTWCFRTSSKCRMSSSRCWIVWCTSNRCSMLKAVMCPWAPSLLGPGLGQAGMVASTFQWWTRSATTDDVPKKVVLALTSDLKQVKCLLEVLISKILKLCRKIKECFATTWAGWTHPWSTRTCKVCQVSAHRLSSSSTTLTPSTSMATLLTTSTSSSKRPIPATMKTFQNIPWAEAANGITSQLSACQLTPRTSVTCSTTTRLTPDGGPTTPMKCLLALTIWAPTGASTGQTWTCSQTTATCEIQAKRFPQHYYFRAWMVQKTL